MKIGYLGCGTWGTALAIVLANNKHEIIAWDIDATLIQTLRETKKHPKLTEAIIPDNIHYVDRIEEALDGIDMIIESVTASGVRPVLKEIMSIKKELKCPFILTSKGIEQNTGLLLPEVFTEVCGEKYFELVGCIGGPSHAEEVVRQLPTSVVCASKSKSLMKDVSNIFLSPYFRVYPNEDIYGVSFGGALKNIIAIACGISDALHLGTNTKAALLTRGLHEMRKLSATKNCNPETLNGLSGLGDLFVTCSSTLSRNYRFGRLFGLGNTMEEAKEKIGMAVEGTYTCVSAYELGKKHDIPIPITSATYAVLYENMPAKEAVTSLMLRPVKEEYK